ncbi:MAG: hypothetical protein FWE71_16875 [Nocardioidaceae bacterium]|nr:hypothetical protein [Nocardioidaceae bacterium]MCL2612408.1 hypothetical protein [Nocardioidaceae bacterium]
MFRRSRPVVLGLLIAVCLAPFAPTAYADSTSPATPPGTSATPAATGATPAPTDPATPSPTPSDPVGQVVAPLLQQAQHALSQVKQVFGKTSTGPSSAPKKPIDATMALRNLRSTYRALPRRQQRTAERFFARPTNKGALGCYYDNACYKTKATHELCDTKICIHYVLQADDPTNGVPSGDFEGVAAQNGVPGYVRFALQTMEYVNKTYKDAGYRATLGDAKSSDNGGDGRFDVYLADLGSSLYGYTQSDDPRTYNDRAGNKHTPSSAYLVLDNDYNHNDFPEHTPGQNLQVTAAHEYFHAVQFAYDYDEDAWMMEATATWAEDELYTNINDNRGYLRSGPMRHAQNPLDAYEGNNEYGAWIFFRYLTEKYPTKVGNLPVLIRQIWTRCAKSGKGAHNQYSLQAINSVLGYHHTSLATQYVDFALANRFPWLYYSEGAAPVYHHGAALFRSAHLTRGKPSRTTTVKLQRLSARHLRYVPGTGLRGSSQIRITANGPTKATGGMVAVRIKPVGKPMKRVRFALNKFGDGGHTFAFGKGKIQWVEISVLNTSTRYKCNVYGGNTAYWTHTCKGRPVDNANTTKVTVDALR